MIYKINSFWYKIGGRPGEGEGLTEYGQCQTKGGEGSKNSRFDRMSIVNGPLLFQLLFSTN